jgi:membrane protease YdiL (CAAX protease family)
MAALAEEFQRYIVMTRLRYLIDNPLICIVVASLVWALLHAPVAMTRGSGDIAGVASYILRIVPLGFVWGYTAYRTGSILPAVFCPRLEYLGATERVVDSWN